MGLEVFALGVGKRCSIRQLIQIASNRRHIFTMDFRNLGSFVRAVKGKACRGRKACPLYTARTFDLNLTTGFHLVTIKHYILTLTINTICSTVNRGSQRGDRDPVSRTNLNKIHASRFESVIVGETSGKRSFHDQTQIIHESRIPHEINHASQAFRYSRITFLFK